MEFGYLLTDFPIWDENDNVRYLKCTNLVLKNSMVGNIVFDLGSPYDTDKFIFDLKDQFDLELSDFDGIFLSHLHPDHLGVINKLKNKKIYLSKNDLLFLIDMINVYKANESIYDFLVTNTKSYKQTFTRNDEKNVLRYLSEPWSNLNFLDNNDIINIDEEKNKCDIFKYIKPIETPGHTHNHYSYSIDNKVFYTGDAVSNRLILLTDNKTIIEPQMNNDDYLKSIEIVKKFSGIFVGGHDIPFDSNTLKGIRERKFLIKF